MHIFPIISRDLACEPICLFEVVQIPKPSRFPHVLLILPGAVLSGRLPFGGSGGTMPLSQFDAYLMLMSWRCLVHKVLRKLFQLGRSDWKAFEDLLCSGSLNVEDC